MSNHFTYEIDERNLRTQLKEYSVPVSEEAWQKFETFSDSMVSNQRENKYNSFNFTLNRNVVLPSVFGIIIIIFSFLLVNFVSIKNPVKENTKKAAKTTISQDAEDPKIETKNTIPVPVNKPKPQIAATTGSLTGEAETSQNNTAVAGTEIVKETAKQDSKINIPESHSSNINTSPITNSVSAINSSSETSPDSVANTAADEEAKAKRRAKRRAEAVESQKLLEIRPTPVTEERDAEIRPN